jgi:hypothetical protein
LDSRSKPRNLVVSVCDSALLVNDGVLHRAPEMGEQVPLIL